MGIIFKAGKTIHGYEIVREMNRGAFAIAYEARAPTGKRVFFKQYNSPSKLVDWYDGFVDHQKEIKRRIESDPAAKDRCYRFVEFFEESAFFQVFEFVEGGNDLGKFLAGKGSLSWQQAVTFAKVMMFGIKALHQVKIVHTDLKPDNVFLIPDGDIGVGFKLRIIDLDWAIFTDRPAPWHGRQGYIGTAAYQSPEHLVGTVPLPASDLFTCGIILGEILGAGHPFAGAGADGYDAAVRSGEFQRIALRQPIERVDNQAFLESVLNSCLDPDPGRRPTAAQVCDALIGKTFPWHAHEPEAETPAPRSTPGRTPVRDPVLPGRDVTPAVRQYVEIRHNGSHVTTVSTDAEFGKQFFKALHADAQFLSNPQFTLLRQDAGWIIEHCPSATNETLVDGGKLVAPVPVRDGMRVAVGSSAKGIEKLPLEFKLVCS